MSLFGSMQIGNNALRAAQIGLQVTGQNIANANTPGYIREEVIFAPAPTQQVGTLSLGLGVQVEGIVQKIDLFLEDRLRGAISDRVNSETKEEIYLQLEAIVGELGEQDLSTSMNRFFSSIADILNQPESIAVRNLATLHGETLAEDIKRMAERALTVRKDLNTRVEALAEDANRLLEEIRTLNIRIAETEGGSVSNSEAVGLRDQRNTALSRLAEIIDIRVEEQPSGGVAVFAEGTFLVFEGSLRHVEVERESDRGVTVSSLRIAETEAILPAGSGELAGLIEARDEIAGGFLEQLDDFAATLAFEFNQVFASGQGLTGYQELTSQFQAENTTLPLDEAGFPFEPRNGSFEVQIRDRDTNAIETTVVRVDLNGLDQDTSLDNLVTQLEAIDGLSAELDANGRLLLSSESSNQDFSFGRDSSGILAVLGVNTFFTGSTALDLGINSDIREDPSKFAVSQEGVGANTRNGEILAAFLDRPLQSKDGESIASLYDRITGDLTQSSSVARAVADGFRTFEQTLNEQSLAISGVSLDEEAVRMIAFQRMYQASARYIATISELLETLVNL